MSTLYNLPLINNAQYTLGSGYTSGGSSLTLNQSVAGILQAPGVVVVDRIDSNGNVTPTKRTYYAFTGVSSATLSGLSVVDGTDQAHSIGAIVEAVVDVTTIGSYYTALTNLVTSTGALDTTKVVDLTTAQTLTNKTLTAPIISTISNTGTVTLPTSTDTLVGRATTDTLTNKRITKRTGTVTTSATPTINTDNVDIFTITALADNITSFTTNLSGTPTIGQTLIIRILDAGVSKTISWGASFASRGATLPTTTTAGKYTYVGLIWNSVTSTFDCIAAVTEA